MGSRTQIDPLTKPERRENAQALEGLGEQEVDHETAYLRGQVDEAVNQFCYIANKTRLTSQEEVKDALSIREKALLSTKPEELKAWITKFDGEAKELKDMEKQMASLKRNKKGRQLLSRAQRESVSGVLDESSLFKMRFDKRKTLTEMMPKLFEQNERELQELKTTARNLLTLAPKYKKKTKWFNHIFKDQERSIDEIREIVQGEGGDGLMKFVENWIDAEDRFQALEEKGKTKGKAGGFTFIGRQEFQNMSSWNEQRIYLINAETLTTDVETCLECTVWAAANGDFKTAKNNLQLISMRTGEMNPDQKSQYDDLAKEMELADTDGEEEEEVALSKRHVEDEYDDRTKEWGWPPPKQHMYKEAITNYDTWTLQVLQQQDRNLDWDRRDGRITSDKELHAVKQRTERDSLHIREEGHEFHVAETIDTSTYGEGTTGRNYSENASNRHTRYRIHDKETGEERVRAANREKSHKQDREAGVLLFEGETMMEQINEARNHNPFIMEMKRKWDAAPSLQERDEDEGPDTLAFEQMQKEQEKENTKPALAQAA